MARAIDPKPPRVVLPAWAVEESSGLAATSPWRCADEDEDESVQPERELDDQPEDDDEDERGAQPTLVWPGATLTACAGSQFSDGISA